MGLALDRLFDERVPVRVLISIDERMFPQRVDNLQESSHSPQPPSQARYRPHSAGSVSLNKSASGLSPADDIIIDTSVKLT